MGDDVAPRLVHEVTVHRDFPADRRQRRRRNLSGLEILRGAVFQDGPARGRVRRLEERLPVVRGSADEGADRVRIAPTPQADRQYQTDRDRRCRSTRSGKTPARQRDDSQTSQQPLAVQAGNCRASRGQAGDQSRATGARPYCRPDVSNRQCVHEQRDHQPLQRRGEHRVVPHRAVRYHEGIQGRQTAGNTSHARPPHRQCGRRDAANEQHHDRHVQVWAQRRWQMQSGSDQ